MTGPFVINNKWTEKAWRDPLKHRITADKPTQDSTPHVVKKADDSKLAITYNRANRIKTLRGLRKATGQR
jgi:hypothetical protein